MQECGPAAAGLDVIEGVGMEYRVLNGRGNIYGIAAVRVPEEQ